MKSKIIFRYSDIYDMNLAKWMQERWKDENKSIGIVYAEKIQNRWDKINNKVFSILESFGFLMPTEIIAYTVSPWKKVTSFSDPLTFTTNNNVEEVFSIICHELIHIAISYKDNKKLKKEIYLRIQNKFSDESYATRMHIAVNFLQKILLSKIAVNYKELLQKDKNWDEKIYPGLKRAWHILDSELKHLDEATPIASLKNL